jgi:hypothetical protein
MTTEMSFGDRFLMTLLSRYYSVGKRLSLEGTLGRITAALPSWEAASNRGGLWHADATGCEALCEAWVRDSVRG